MKKLVIDLGHGGYDSGAVGKNGTKESDVVLNIGKYLDSMLKEVNLDIRFTRLSDKHLSLEDRVKFANDFKADYFLSIHINSCNDNTVRGVESWQYNNNDENLNAFSSNLCKDISSAFNIRNRGVKYSKNLYVLKNTSMKSVLIEVDFISNIFCENDLNDEENIKKIATIINNNILKLYDLKENKKVYKVCVGAYNSKDNAYNILNILKNKGFNDAYIL